MHMGDLEKKKTAKWLQTSHKIRFKNTLKDYAVIYIKQKTGQCI